MSSPTRWTWVWVNSRSWWWTGRPDVLRFMGSQRVGHDWLNWLIPQFGLLSHVSSLRLPSGHSSPVLTLSNAARASLFSPGLLVVYVSVWATSPLGVAVRCVTCGFYLSIFSSWLCCPLRFQNSPQTRQWEGFLVFGKFSSFTPPSLEWVSVPGPFVSLFIFYILSYLLLKTMDCLSGCLVFRSCFVEFSQCSNDLSMNLWGRKWSPCPIPLPS